MPGRHALQHGRLVAEAVKAPTRRPLNVEAGLVVIRSTGEDAHQASARPARALAAPAPVTVTHTPGLPLTLA